MSECDSVQHVLNPYHNHFRHALNSKPKQRILFCEMAGILKLPSMPHESNKLSTVASLQLKPTARLCKTHTFAQTNKIIYIIYIYNHIYIYN